MTSLLDSIAGLFTEHEPAKAPDQSYPKESTEYWEDTSVGAVVYEPPVNGADTTNTRYKPTADKILPGYRGVEEHGVPYDAAVNFIVPQSPDLTDPDEPSVEVMESELILPIAVTVVDMPTPIGRESKVSTNRVDLTFSALAPSAVMIAPKSLRRETVRLAVTGDDVVWVSTDEQNAVSNGFPVTAGMGIVTMHCTDPLYGVAQVADATICVMEEYTVSAREPAL